MGQKNREGDGVSMLLKTKTKDHCRPKKKTTNQNDKVVEDDEKASRARVRCLFYVVVLVAAAYYLIEGVWLMYRASRSLADILGIAVPIGKKLIGNMPNISDRDIGASMVFMEVPLLGILTVTVLFMLLEAIRMPMAMEAKVPIVSWLTVCFFLGVALPFAEVKVAAIKEKAYFMLSLLVTVLAALINFHRKDD